MAPLVPPGPHLVVDDDRWRDDPRTAAEAEVLLQVVLPVQRPGAGVQRRHVCASGRWQAGAHVVGAAQHVVAVHAVEDAPGRPDLGQRARVGRRERRFEPVVVLVPRPCPRLRPASCRSQGREGEYGCGEPTPSCHLCPPGHDVPSGTVARRPSPRSTWRGRPASVRPGRRPRPRRVVVGIRGRARRRVTRTPDPRPVMRYGGTGLGTPRQWGRGRHLPSRARSLPA